MMKLAQVLPIQKGVFKEELSYFTTHDVTPGALVQVPLNKKQITSLVVEVSDAAAAKAALRQADFSLRKISKIVAPHFFMPELVEAAQATAQYYVCSTGQILSLITPKAILEKGISSHKKEVPPESTTGALKTEEYVIQDSDPERMSVYKSIVREAFAKHASVYLCLPTVADIERTLKSVEKGIGPYAVTLHSKLTPKKLLENWQRALSSEHPVLIIATPHFLGLPRADLKTLIFDRESSSHYRNTRSRPHFDFRYLVRHYARACGIKLVLGDAALRTETMHAVEEGLLAPLVPLKQRLITEAESIIINVNRENKIEKSKRFQALGDELRELMGHMRNNNERLVIITGRKGLAPITICNDCESVVRCNRCDAPITAHKNHKDSEEENIFICHHCGQEQTIEDTCALCGSWRLALLGIGLDKITAELKEHFKDRAIYALDSDLTPTAKQAAAEVDKFMSSGGGVLVGTEMALNYLSEPVENFAFVGVDSLFTIPDFTMREKMLNLLLRGKSLALKRFIIQTRNPSESTYTTAIRGNLLDFFREEIAARKQFRYPPFATLIKISGLDAKGTPLINEITKDLKPENIFMFESSVGSSGKTAGICLIKLEPDQWPEANLLADLKRLSPSFSIEVNPQTVF